MSPEVQFEEELVYHRCEVGILQKGQGDWYLGVRVVDVEFERHEVV